jgi:L-iditol 2-dehydrogenase
MAEKMRAAYFVEPGRMEVRETVKPTPGPGEVLVQVKAVGICGSDMTIFRYGGIGVNKATRPLIIGHEGAGVVAEVGPGVQRWQPGDRVVMEAGIPCRRCEFCKSGNYHLCLDVAFAGVPNTDGYMTEYVVMPEDFVFALPEELGFAAGTVIEPLSIGLMAAREADIQVGHSVAVFGSGPIGLATVLAARVRGATRIFVTDIVPRRLEVALELGADEAIDGRNGDAVERILEATNGKGVDRSMETAGSPQTVAMAIKAVKRGGTVGLVGVLHQAEVPVDVVRIVRSAIRVHGVFRYANIHPVAVDLVRAGRVSLDPFVTHTFPLEDIQQALEFVESHKDQVIKGVILL